MAIEVADGRRRPGPSALEATIRTEIAQRGPMTFARFMELALYHPEHGYYEQERPQTGRAGDYYTNVCVGSLYGELLAFQFSDWLGELGAGPFQLVEGGAHDGQLALDILTWMQAWRPRLFERTEYWILEPSTRRRARQARKLAPCHNKVRWWAGWEALPATGITGVVFSNELLDSLPVHRMGWDAHAQRWVEWGVGLEQPIAAPDDTLGPLHLRNEPDEQAFSQSRPGASTPARMPAKAVLEGRHFQWVRLGADDLTSAQAAHLPALTSRTGFERLALSGPLRAILPDGFTTELCPAATQWWSRAAHALRAGWLGTVDYGLEAEEFFAPERRSGTLRAYADHRFGDQLLERAGQQDLTAHVDFTALRTAGEAEGLTTEAWLSQETFLMRITESVCERAPEFPLWTAARRRQLHTLVRPDHLGRPFRVLCQRRHSPG